MYRQLLLLIIAFACSPSLVQSGVIVRASSTPSETIANSDDLASWVVVESSEAVPPCDCWTDRPEGHMMAPMARSQSVAAGAVIAHCASVVSPPIVQWWFLLDDSTLPDMPFVDLLPRPS